MGPGIGTIYSWEGAVWQEPNVWFRNGKWHILYSAGGLSTGGGIGYAYATSPAQAWTKPLNHPVIGQGYGGSSAGQVVEHTGLYIEADTIYFTASISPHTTTLMLFSAPLDFDPSVGPAFALIGAIMALPSGQNGWGNSHLVPIVVGSSYGLLFETRDSQTTAYKIGLATASDLLSSGPTFTVDTFPLMGLLNGVSRYYNDPQNLMTGGPWVTSDSGIYTCMFHAGAYAYTQTDIFRATSTDLRNWTIDNNGLPIVRRTAQAEVDQCADPHLAQGEAGNWWLFEEGVANRQPTATIFAIPVFAVQGVVSNGVIEITYRVGDNFAERRFNEPFVPAAPTTTYNLRNRDDIVFNLSLNSVTANLPYADWGAVVRVGAAQAVGSNRVTLVPKSGDILIGSAVMAAGFFEARAVNRGIWLVNGGRIA